MNGADLVQHVRAALEDLKAVDPVTLEVTDLTSVTDYMIVATGTSGRHVRALADHVAEELRAHDVRPLGVEGQESGEWVLLDFGDAVVHVMQAETRRFYDLEKLWSTPPAAAAVD